MIAGNGTQFFHWVASARSATQDCVEFVPASHATYISALPVECGREDLGKNFETHQRKYIVYESCILETRDSGPFMIQCLTPSKCTRSTNNAFLMLQSPPCYPPTHPRSLDHLFLLCLYENLFLVLPHHQHQFLHQQVPSPNFQRKDTHGENSPSL